MLHPECQNINKIMCFARNIFADFLIIQTFKTIAFYYMNIKI